METSQANFDSWPNNVRRRGAQGERPAMTSRSTMTDSTPNRTLEGEADAPDPGWVHKLLYCVTAVIGPPALVVGMVNQLQLAEMLHGVRWFFSQSPFRGTTSAASTAIKSFATEGRIAAPGGDLTVTAIPLILLGCVVANVLRDIVCWYAEGDMALWKSAVAAVEGGMCFLVTVGVIFSIWEAMPEASS